MSWTKKFINGDSIKEPLSWSKTQLEGIESVHLEANNKYMSLHGPMHQFWQSDTFEATMTSGQSKSQLIERRIECQIKPEDELLFVYKQDNGSAFFIGNIDNTYKFNINNSRSISSVTLKDKTNKWLVAEVHVATNQWKYYFSDERI